MVYIDGDRLQDTIRGYWHYYGHMITRGWTILYPSSCLSLPCSFFRPRPAISHSAQSWNVLLKISVCAHLSSLSPWGQEMVIHCSLCSILASICKLNQMNLSGEIVIFGWLLFSIHTLLIRLMSRGIESTCKWKESSINQKSSSPPSDNPSERCFCGRTSHFIFIQQWLHQ